MTEPRKLRVFLCHASQDKPVVRELYQRLLAEGWIDPWLDEEKLLPGQDWDMEIEKAVEAADAVIVCLSDTSITKEGYVQKEIKGVLDISDQKPEGTIFIIPLRLNDCQPPRRLTKWQYIDYFPNSHRKQIYQRLLQSLETRANTQSLQSKEPEKNLKHTKFARTANDKSRHKSVGSHEFRKTDLLNEFFADENQDRKFTPNGHRIYTFSNLEFVKVPAGKFFMGSSENDKDAFQDEKPQSLILLNYDYYISRFPITNEQYNTFVESEGIWHPLSSWREKPRHPIMYFHWEDMIQYCKWLNTLIETIIPSNYVLRLPTEAEWEKAARGTDARIYPWGDQFDENRCNSYEGKEGELGAEVVTDVDAYSPQGDSPYGVADMSGNVWEWTQTVYRHYPYKIMNERSGTSGVSGNHVARGGGFGSDSAGVRAAARYGDSPDVTNALRTFRVVIAPFLPYRNK